MNELDREFKAIMGGVYRAPRVCLFTSDGEPECNLPYHQTCMKKIIVTEGLCLFNDRRPIQGSFFPRGLYAELREKKI
jgi:hypothetical protein